MAKSCLIKMLVIWILIILIKQISTTSVTSVNLIEFDGDDKSHISQKTELIQHFEGSNNVNYKTKEIIFVLLLPNHESANKNDCILPKVLPVLELAIEHIQQLGFYHANINITLISRDSFCSSIYGPIGFFEIYTKWQQVHAVFGLACEYVLAPISRYAGVWRIPVLTAAGNAADFDKKAESYPTLTRLRGAQANNLGNAVRALIESYNWTRSALLYQNENRIKGNSVCFFCIAVVHNKLQKMSVLQQAFDTSIVTKKQEIAKMLLAIVKQVRIIIMCADPQSIRQIMLTAEELNMIDSGEYVFINIELFSRVPHIISQPWFDRNDTLENNERARKAYTAMLTVTPKQPNDDEYKRVSNEIKTIAAAKYNYTFHENEPISAFVTSFFDGVLLYAKALNDSLKENPNLLTRPINGTDIVRRMWNRTFMGITGNVTIDANGDRISAYSLLDMNPMTGHFEIVAHFLHNRLEYVADKKIHWSGNRQTPPPDRPICGYDGSLCPDNSLPGYAILSIILGAMVIIMIICFFIGYRHYKSEAEINSMTWKVAIDDVLFHDVTGRVMRGGSFHSLVKQSSQWTLISEDMGSFSGDRQIFIPVGVYKNSKVAIKLIDEQNINLTRSLMLELKRMKDLQHDHLVKFYGACLDPAKSFLLTEYCPKGSLQDILENEQFQLDWMFRLSLIHDIVRGMQFLHTSDIKSHGNLKSSNCVVDSRFILKITDFGLHSLRNARYNKGSDVENCNSHAYWGQFLWTAPELLKMEDERPAEGTQKGDVYSFGIIVHEITTRQGPFFLGAKEMHKSPQEIIQLVKSYPNISCTPFRPKIDSSEKYADINALMTKCWAEDAYERPDFNVIKTIIRKINKDNETGNIVDNLLKRMEQYANNLEELVEERTQDYLEEKKKCEKLLYQLLPQSVAAQLIRGQPVVAETFDQVTIYFSDIVGFTAISAESTPMQVVQFLNDLYTCFDSIVENFDVYKVETIGDAYMVVSGLPIRNGNQHAREIARMALALLEGVHNFRIHHRPDDKLKLRIGLHTGACVAGVVGLKMPRYCLFGDTVNTASRMESNGEALKIHISENTKNALDEFGTFITSKRGYVPVKGKGEMLTYWLEGELNREDSPILNRRASLRKPSKLFEELPPYKSDNYEQQTPICAAYIDATCRSVDRVSVQNSPDLQKKRKISCSSPKLSDSYDDNLCIKKTDTSSNFMEFFKPSAKITDRYKQQREENKDNWELTNFRLPLSGALKSHNNNLSKISLNPLLPSNSNSNISIVPQANNNMRSRHKFSQPSKLNMPAVANSESVSLYSGNRIRFSIHDKSNPTSPTCTDYDQSTAVLRLFDDKYLDKAVRDRSKLQIRDSKNNLSTTDNNIKSYNNIVLVNNVKNFKLLSNSIGDGGVTSASTTTTNNNATAASTNNAVTQPLLAKINS